MPDLLSIFHHHGARPLTPLTPVPETHAASAVQPAAAPAPGPAPQTVSIQVPAVAAVTATAPAPAAATVTAHPHMLLGQVLATVIMGAETAAIVAVQPSIVANPTSLANLIAGFMSIWVHPAPAPPAVS